MPANLENSAVATGLKKVTIHSNQSQRKAMPRMLKLPQIALISHASKVNLLAQNSPGQALAICELQTS